MAGGGVDRSACLGCIEEAHVMIQPSPLTTHSFLCRSMLEKFDPRRSKGPPAGLSLPSGVI